MNVHKVLASAHVERYHTRIHVKNQTLDRHLWGVSVLVQYFDPTCRKELILAALTHDCSELATGDTPAPVKWLNPELKAVLDTIEYRTNVDWGIHYELSLDETTLLKVCDYIEGMLYCYHRVICGELTAAIPFHKYYTYLVSNTGLSGKQQEFLNPILTRMAEIDHGQSE